MATNTTTETVTFDVEGMTCASCAMRIERVLGKQEGVESAVVNLTGKEAKVTVHPGIEMFTLTSRTARRPCFYKDTALRCDSKIFG